MTVTNYPNMYKIKRDGNKLLLEKAKVVHCVKPAMPAKRISLKRILSDSFFFFIKYT